MNVQTLIFLTVIALLVVLGALFPPLFIVYAIVALIFIGISLEERSTRRRRR